MAADPSPFDVMASGGRIEAAPHIFVLDRLPVRGAPAVALPAVEPSGHAAAQILRVGVQAYGAWTGQRIERLDRRREFHAVIGGEGLAALQLLRAGAVAQHGAPPAGSRIARAGAVRPDRHSPAHPASPQ